MIDRDWETRGPKYFCTSNNGSPIPPPPPSVINLKSSASIKLDNVGPPGKVGSSKSFTLFKNSLAFALTTG